MEASKSAIVIFSQAWVRLNTRPAPCGAEQFQSGFPLPVHRSEPSRMLSGMIHFSPTAAEIEPLRIMLSSLI